jgi:hypothetical protein
MDKILTEEVMMKELDVVNEHLSIMVDKVKAYDFNGAKSELALYNKEFKMLMERINNR